MKKIFVSLGLILLFLAACGNAQVPAGKSYDPVGLSPSLSEDSFNVRFPEDPEGVEVKPEIGFIAPSFGAQDYNGNVVWIEQFRGKPAMLNFWAGWCPFCLEEMPAMALIQEEFQDKAAVIAVNRGEKSESAKKFTDALNVSDAYTILLDTNDVIYRLYKGRGMPITFFIDRTGIIRDIKYGPMDSDEMRERLQPLI